MFFQYATAAIFTFLGFVANAQLANTNCTQKVLGSGYYLETVRGNKLSFLNLDNCKAAESLVVSTLESQEKVVVWGCERHTIPALTGRDPMNIADYGVGVFMQSYYIQQNNRMYRTVSLVRADNWAQAEEKCISKVRQKYN